MCHSSNPEPVAGKDSDLSQAFPAAASTHVHEIFGGPFQRRASHSSNESSEHVDRIDTSGGSSDRRACGRSEDYRCRGEKYDGEGAARGGFEGRIEHERGIKGLYLGTHR